MPYLGLYAWQITLPSHSAAHHLQSCCAGVALSSRRYTMQFTIQLPVNKDFLNKCNFYLSILLFIYPGSTQARILSSFQLLFKQRSFRLSSLGILGREKCLRPLCS